MNIETPADAHGSMTTTLDTNFIDPPLFHSQKCFSRYWSLFRLFCLNADPIYKEKLVQSFFPNSEGKTTQVFSLHVLIRPIAFYSVVCIMNMPILTTSLSPIFRYIKWLETLTASSCFYELL